MLRKNKHIYLCGFMGSGKSTIGRLLAEKLNRPFIDTDEEIEKTTNRSVAEIFRGHGEPEFRKFEKELIRKISALQTPSVIALGGGSLMDGETLRIVKETGILIYLQCSADVLKQRLKDTPRPLLKTESIETLMEKRLKGYEWADKIMNNDFSEISKVTEILISEIANNFLSQR